MTNNTTKEYPMAVEINTTTEYPIDLYEYEIYVDPSRKLDVIESICLVSKIVILVLGLLCNLVFLAVIIRCRLWRRHNGYVTLAVLLVSLMIFVLTEPLSSILHLMDVFFPVRTPAGCWCVQIFIHVVVASPRWLLVALLLYVLLHDCILTPNRKCASVFCTPLGMTFVSISIFGASFIATLIYVGIHHDRIYHWYILCRMSPDYVHFVLWTILKLYLPLIVFTPILLIAIVCRRRRNVRIQFTQLDRNAAGAISELERTAVWAGLATVFCHLPLGLLQLVIVSGINYDPHKIYDWWLILPLIGYSYAFVVPLICLGFNSEVRQFFRSKVIKKCPSWCRVVIPCFSPETDDEILMHKVENDYDQQ